MISVTSSGSFKNTERFLTTVSKLDISSILHSSGQQGVAALVSATPTDSGLTAASWDYEVGKKGGSYFIVWTNSDVENGFPVAIMLQFGYGTGTGGYVAGRDYINPAIRPVFDQILDKVWRVVTSA